MSRRRKITVVSGIRDVDPEWIPDIELAMAGEVAVSREIRFGGALGVDTFALEAVCKVRRLRRVVYVPFKLRDQPRATLPAIDHCSTRVIELNLPRSKDAYLQRNRAMLKGADRLLAFWDGRHSGGTWWTIKEAHKMRLPVQVVSVTGSRTQTANPKIAGPFSKPVFAWAPYVSRRRGEKHWPSEVMRAIKAQRAKYVDVRQMADVLRTVVNRHPELRSADAIVPMPRRIPWQENDLKLLADELGAMIDKPVLDDWLVRVKEPTDGVTKMFRTRFTPEEHAGSLAVPGGDGLWPRVILLDNVITTGGTMEGAIRAVTRDTDAEPVGLAVLWSHAAGLQEAA